MATNVRSSLQASRSLMTPQSLGALRAYVFMSTEYPIFIFDTLRLHIFHLFGFLSNNAYTHMASTSFMHTHNLVIVFRANFESSGDSLKLARIQSLCCRA